MTARESTSAFNYYTQSDADKTSKTSSMLKFIEHEGLDAEQIDKLVEDARVLMVYYRCAMMEVETKFKVLNEHFSMKSDRNPISTITTRLKTPDSIREKMLRRDIPLNLDALEDQLFDVAGVRIVCPFLDDVYLLADCLLQQDDIQLVQRKDYIKNPKENGYRSLHLIIEVPIFLPAGKKMVKVEVQLRTIAMESWANLEHKLRYKKDLDEELQNMMSRELKECAALSASLDEKMQNIRHSIDIKKWYNSIIEEMGKE